ncbi:hypothetical protein [Hyphomicrobium sp.]|uniref:hypothetical protein n=1 Tax=Hyphomicrobium sp. TaxID=82 RepID=UPI002FDDD1F1
MTAGERERESLPRGLFLFCLAMMCSGFAINAAFIAIAVPAMAPYGVQGLIVAGLAGSVFGVFPARWLARKIHEGLRED